MMRKKRTNLLSVVLKPSLIIILLVGMFGLVYLKSHFVKLEYAIGELEKKKMYCLRERQKLYAEKTSQLSYARLESSSGDGGGFVLPDRLQVVHVSKQMRSLPQPASLQQKQLSGP